MIYFIREKRPGGRIKIGYSRNVPQRSKHLGGCNGSPLEVLAVTEGSRRDERALHRHFKELRCEGKREWFEPGLNLLGYIKNSIVASEPCDDAV